MEKVRKGFVLYCEYKEHLALLSDEEKGQLLMAIFDYVSLDKYPTNLSGLSEMAFSFIKTDLDINREKWERQKQIKSQAGKRSGEVRRALAEANKNEQKRTERTGVHSVEQKRTERTNNVNVNDNVNVNVKANDKVSLLSKANNDDNIIDDKEIDVLQNQIWLESIMMKHHMTCDEVICKLKEFDTHLISIGQEHNSEKEYKKHFNNWIQTVKAYERKNTNDEFSNLSYSERDKRKRAEDFAEYINNKLYRKGEMDNSDI